MANGFKFMDAAGGINDIHYSSTLVTDYVGYCCTDIAPNSYNGLFYVGIVGLCAPLYYLKVESLTPFPQDDIVGWVGHEQLDEQMTNDEIYEQVANWDGPTMAIGGDTSGVKKLLSLIRNYKPGWYKATDDVNGVPGESIVNLKLPMQLVRGDLLDEVINMAVSHELGSREALVREAAQWTQISESADPETIANFIDEDPNEEDAIEQEIARHKANLKKYSYIFS